MENYSPKIKMFNSLNLIDIILIDINIRSIQNHHFLLGVNKIFYDFVKTVFRVDYLGTKLRYRHVLYYLLDHLKIEDNNLEQVSRSMRTLRKGSCFVELL